MTPFFESELCRSGAACRDCRTSSAYRRGIALTFDVDGADFDCPRGVTERRLAELEKAGKIPPDRKRTVAPRSGSAVRASDEVKATRLETCRKCGSFDEDGWRCRECGCGLSAKLATRSARCPKGKW